MPSDRQLSLAFLLFLVGVVLYVNVRKPGDGDRRAKAVRAVADLHLAQVAEHVDKLSRRIAADASARELLEASKESLIRANGPLKCSATHNGQSLPIHCETIFVSVSSFRDPICPITVRELFVKAHNPRRIVVGAVEQHDGEDACVPKEYGMGAANGECNDPLSWCPRDNIRVRKVRPIDAKGPTFGRFVSSLLYRGEKYYMMIDSHNRFLKHWDRVILDNYEKAPSVKKVLSHYPNGYDVDKPNPMDETMVMVMCKQIWIHEMHYSRNGAEWMPTRDKPYAQGFTAAGFLFGDAAFMHEAPFDPYLDYVFDGEELMFTVRLWTHGWDIYGPSRAILFHSYDRHNAKRYWHEPGMNWGDGQRISQRRVQYFLKSVYQNTTKLVVPDPKKEDPRVSVEEDKYGLGKTRSLEQFWKHVGIDWSRRTDGAQKCQESRRS